MHSIRRRNFKSANVNATHIHGIFMRAAENERNLKLPTITWSSQQFGKSAIKLVVAWITIVVIVLMRCAPKIFALIFLFSCVSLFFILLIVYLFFVCVCVCIVKMTLISANSRKRRKHILFSCNFLLWQMKSDFWTMGN